MSISSYTVVTMLDSRPSPITIPLPRTSDILNRIITFKDLFGSASTNTITLVTRNGDTFEDGTFSTIMSNTYQTLNFYAGQPGKWLNIDGGSGGGGSSAGLTTVSNLLNSVSTNVTSISTNVATVSNRLNGVSTNATSISTNVATVSNLLNSVSTNATSISTNVATVSNTVAAGRFTGISTNTISTSLIIAGYVSSPQGYISSLIVDALSFSLSNSFISMGDIITTSVSTIQTFTSTLTTNNLRVGTVSSLNFISFSGLQQGYNQTVIAEQSTGTGIQELLFFKGSTNTDRIRIQTTGPIVFEPGVSARVFPATGSNVTPAMIITTGSNVGIGVAAPTVSLDVAGAGRFTAVSTNTISSSLLTASNISTNSLNSSTVNISSVGINCNSPSYTLDVNGNARVGGMFFNTNAFAWTNGTTHTLYGDSYTGSTKYIQWVYNNTPGTTIADAANMNIACPSVGINQSAPTAQLHVKTSGPPTYVGWDSTWMIVTPSANSGTPGNTPALGLGYSVVSNTSYIASLEPFVAWRNLEVAASNIYLMTTDGGAGNVGINTRSPAYKLDVNGASRMASISTNSISTNIVNAGYLVGLLPGTTGLTSVSPLALTNGSAPAASAPQIEFQASVTGGLKHFLGSRHRTNELDSASNSIDFWLYSASSGGTTASTTPGTCNVNTMSVTARGVGINNNAPTVALDVVGAGRFTAVSTTTISTGTLTVGGSALSARLGIQSNATLTDPASVIITIPNTSYFYADYTNLTNYITISNYGAQEGDYINIVNTGNSGAPATFQILDGSTGVSTNIRYIYPGHAGVVAYSSSEWWPM